MSPSILDILSILVPFLAFLSTATSQSISLPSPLGPCPVGTTRLALRNPHTSRRLSISVFYPTYLPKKNPYHLSPAFSPLFGSFLETSIGLQPGLASKVHSQAWEDAPINLPCTSPKHPRDRKNEDSKKKTEILLFSPGYGENHQEYTATYTNLASNNYLVIAVSHPNDSVFIDYPDGTSVISEPIDLNATSAAEKVDDRVGDMRFIVNVLRNGGFNKLIPGFKKTGKAGKELIKKNVGVLGHSLGGATAASAMFADHRFKCGGNMDGAFWGDVVDPSKKGNPGVRGDFLIMGAEGSNRTSVESWAVFWKGGHKKGQKVAVEISVKGSRHGTYTDLAVLYGYLRKLGLIEELPEELFGPIDGERILKIENAYFDAFFGKCLKDERARLLDGPSPKYPEVKFWVK